MCVCLSLSPLNFFFLFLSLSLSLLLNCGDTMFCYCELEVLRLDPQIDIATEPQGYSEFSGNATLT